MVENELSQGMDSLLEKLKGLPDRRDNRGKRHALPFVVASVLLAVLAGRAQVSSLHRFIRNRIDWLREVTGYPTAQAVSRAHLPRLLGHIDWADVNLLREECLDLRLELVNREWIALDGKTLRGSQAQAERIVAAVTHTSGQTVAQLPMHGPKDNEIAAVHTLLHTSGLECQRVSLDALHCNPATLTQINLAGGHYLVQVKENQPQLLHVLEFCGMGLPVAACVPSCEKNRGRVEKRTAHCIALPGVHWDERWHTSGMTTLVVMERETHHLPQQTCSVETSYYVSNLSLDQAQPLVTAEELAQAIRGHWQVEASNHIRDVTLHEDQIKTTHGQQGQIMAGLRTLAMGLLRKAGLTNFQEALDNFADSPSLFKQFLGQVGFL